MRLWLILFLALALRVAFSFACDVIPNYSDMLEYNQIATGTAVNPQHGYGYASFLRTIYGVFGKMNYLAVFLVQAVIGTMSVALIYYAALKISTRRAALTAALIAAIYPYFIAYGCTTMPETLVVFLVLVMVSVFLATEGWCNWLAPQFVKLTEWVRVPHPRPVYFSETVKSTLSAIVYSFAVFVKPSCLFFAPGLLFLIKKRWRFLWIATPLCILAIGQLPDGGAAQNFYMAHNENATGKYMHHEDTPMDYMQLDSATLVREGLHNVLSNPHMEAKVIWNKIVTVFSPGYDHQVIEPMCRNGGWLFDIFYPCVAVLGILAMIRYPNKIMLPFLSYLALSIMLFTFEYRYRLIFEPIVIMYAGVILARKRV